MHKFDTHIIQNWDDFTRLKSYESKLDSDIPVVYDVETNTAKEKLAHLYGFGMCFTSTKSFYIPWKNPQGEYSWSAEQRYSITEWLKNTLTSRGVIGHNVIFDVLVTENRLGIVLDQFVIADTMLMKHTLEEEPPFALKEIAVKELGLWADNAQDTLKEAVLAAGGKWTKEQKDMYLAPTEVLGTYCCWDVVLTKLLYDSYSKRLETENLVDLFYKDEVMPLYKKATISMKRHGFTIDTEHFEKLKTDINKDIDYLKESMYSEVKPLVSLFEKELLQKEFPINNGGNFPKAIAEVIGAPIPINSKTGKQTLAAKAIKLQKEATPQFTTFYDWVLGDSTIEDLTYSFGDLILEQAQLSLWVDKYETDKVFNFGSNDHLIALFFDIKGYNPIDKTPKGKAKIDDKIIELLATKDDTAKKLSNFKKLNKVSSTYIEGILSRQIDGIIYTSMLQFGTTSGRFSSKAPNLQNLPRIKEEDSGLDPLILKYSNAIREGFIAPKGYKIVDADYSALEPRAFAHMSDDKALQNVFHIGEDLYSRIAIDVFKVSGVSANPKDPNYLGTVQKELRQKTKKFCLAVPYGAEESRIKEEMGVSWKEAKQVINSYLDAYPNLKRYMAMCNYEAKHKGEVKTELGRVRHLKEAKAIFSLYGDNLLDYKWAAKHDQTDLRYKLKNAINNSKNFKIQGLAAHIVNRAMIAIADSFKDKNIDGWIALQIHDQIISIVREDQAEEARAIMKYCMENTTKISVPLIADPEIADNLKESH